MPELPEVETVREGLARWVTGRTVAGMQITHPRSIRRHAAGPEDLIERAVGSTIRAVSRRGKYLWLPLDRSGVPAGALVAHLGMSGQLLVQPPDTPYAKHQHVRVWFTDGGPELRFIDQRTFGGLLLDDLVAVPVPAESDGGAEPEEYVPASIAHIARDPLDPRFDAQLWATRLHRRDTELKRALLDQTLISGIGNIYADESLWRARLHGLRRTGGLSRAATLELLEQVRGVLREALRAGGTSFDALYVNVNGQSGYFDRSLAVYGRVGKPCPRCGTTVLRSAFMNRSSFWCPTCQPRPRARPRQVRS